MINEKSVKYYTIEEISIFLGITIKSTRNRLSKLKLKKCKTQGPRGNVLYSEEQLKIISDNNVIYSKSLEQLITKTTKIKVEVVYYIYESKLNLE
jgi:hypothetical protein